MSRHPKGGPPWAETLVGALVPLAGIEPALTVPKTVVLSVERQRPFDYEEGYDTLL